MFYIYVRLLVILRANLHCGGLYILMLASLHVFRPKARSMNYLYFLRPSLTKFILSLIFLLSLNTTILSKSLSSLAVPFYIHFETLGAKNT